jgi:hypothetical protein
MVRIPRENLNYSDLVRVVTRIEFQEQVFDSLDSFNEFIEVQTGEIVKIFCDDSFPTFFT